ncbi:hypothetical protein AURDEDRAFT_157066 [Auricularia subglabra TFB-10046 SS5]|nr:hypothetical protein AURDEDRAFT_157066 [Auricularia subglabra TFB-10046 SS5]
MSLLLARNALRPRAAQRVFMQARGAAHFENTLYNNMPFRYDTGKGKFAAKLIGYCAFGFSIPIIAVWVTFKKNGK